MHVLRIKLDGRGRPSLHGNCGAVEVRGERLAGIGLFDSRNLFGRALRDQAAAVAAYRAIGLRDYARFDMRMLGDEPQILDVNANPELDPESVVLAGARAIGLNYGAMAARIVDFAAARMPAR